MQKHVEASQNNDITVKSLRYLSYWNHTGSGHPEEKLTANTSHYEIIPPAEPNIIPYS